MEELLLKDNEKMPFDDDIDAAIEERAGFTPDEMVRCETCLRANPPTRANCLYCAAALSVSKKISDQRAITLKPLEDSVAGYNCIKVSARMDANQLSVASQLVKISESALKRIIEHGSPLPLARTASREEAELLTSKLRDFGVDTIVLGDAELGVFDSSALVQARAAEISEEEIRFKQIGGDEGVRVSWADIQLIVSGRLLSKRVESAEQKGRRGDEEIVDATEFFADELRMDLYLGSRKECFRIAANRFDFSSLPQRKLIAAENFALLIDLIRSKSPAAAIDESYCGLRQLLDSVWPSGQHTASGGWRRDRPGKYLVGAITESSNLNQFNRYSRLRWFLRQHSSATA